jgi:gamma-glutamyl hercynylcysteine S-oxide hydrolase
MCRLLAHASAAPTTFLDVLGAANTRRFEAMSLLHDDGWGSMWVDQQGDPREARVRRLRDTAPGHQDGKLHTVLHEVAVRTRVVHLRMATRSMRVLPENTHPFLVPGPHGTDGVGMAHNGAIVPSAELRTMVAPDLLAQVYGTTDSELYFAIVRDGLREGIGIARALERAVAVIRTAYPSASLNAMALTPEKLVVVHSSLTARVPFDDFEEFLAGGLGVPLPRDHNEAYYRMSYRQDADGTFVAASAGMDTAGWNDLPQDSITSVDLATMTVQVDELRHAYAG